MGITDKELQTRLLREDPTLNNVIKYCQLVEQAEIHRRIVQEESSNEINVVEQNSYHKNTEHNQNKKKTTNTDWKKKEGQLSRQKSNNNKCKK